MTRLCLNMQFRGWKGHADWRAENARLSHAAGSDNDRGVNDPQDVIFFVQLRVCTGASDAYTSTVSRGDEP